MNNLRDKQRLEHILQAIADIELISENGITDKKTYYSVIYLIQIIGEAANKLSEEIKEKYSNISWREIISMRNFIAHEYDKIDLNIVSDTVKYDIPVLKQQIETILKELSS
jgi:uncharacterized protein with HEPN domain